MTNASRLSKTLKSGKLGDELTLKLQEGADVSLMTVSSDLKEKPKTRRTRKAVKWRHAGHIFEQSDMVET